MESWVASVSPSACAGRLFLVMTLLLYMLQGCMHTTVTCQAIGGSNVLDIMFLVLFLQCNV